MKKLYFLLITVCFLNVLSAQVINFPDAKLKAKLLTAASGNTVPVASIQYVNPGYPTYYNKIDTNNDGEIQISEALLIKSLDISNANITDLTGLSYFSNLHTLFCHSNKISNLSELNLIPSLVQFQMNYNTGSLSQIDLSNLINLKTLTCISDNLTLINVSNNVRLESISCQDNKLTSLDVSNCPNLNWLVSFYNQLEFLNIKNGNTNNWGKLFIHNGERYLRYICADEEDLSLVQKETSNLPNCHVNTYCSFTPGGTFYTIEGNQKLDFLNDGCDSDDNLIPYSKYLFSDGTSTQILFANNFGSYYIPVQAGEYTLTPLLENPSYFSITPQNITVNFPTQVSPFIQNFCVSNFDKHDVEVIVVPINSARPGFEANYKIIYKNKGNRIENGTINLQFKDAVLELVDASPVASTQTEGNLSWIFSNLKPFETREITFTLDVNSPMEIPAVNNGDILKFVTTIASQSADETPLDNTFTLNQTVVGSYDPNDKTCLEGSLITPSLIGEYVHYMIRFENTGTYAAQNIVVKDMIDLSKFDISTLIPTSSSHSFVTKISEGNKAEFIFENINLPFDDANNDGYVAFKIKTLPTLKVGDSFTNEANIYFDYNFPILTNKATSKFQTTLSNPDFEFSNYFTLYPNPVNDVLNINAKQDIEIQSLAIYDILGQLIIAVPNAKSVSAVDVSKLRTGNYFIKVKTDKGSSGMKFIKK
ncbi:T9SS type A sorting domain-containing protein [Flavobacterium sp. DGU38]|uniref:T9SS type A sorting domain-containing protein n=1 Tax=Flavobacterium calami TaxID=3139144 RepID=A0ABU9IQ99_9FLAO